MDMKRPLCLFVFSFALLMFLLQVCVMSPSSSLATLQNRQKQQQIQAGSRVQIMGCLQKREKKNNRLIYYLSDVQIIYQFSTENSGTNSKTNSNSKTNPNINSNINSTTNSATYAKAYAKTNLPQTPTIEKEKESIGAVCYMAESENMREHPIGRWLCIEGTFHPYEHAENDGQFDAADYYASIGYHVRIQKGVVMTQGDKYQRFQEGVVNIKRKASNVFYRHMREENAGIMAAMLLGDKAAMDTEIKDLYRKSGIAHVLAISGLHISLVGMFFYRALLKCYIPSRICCVVGMILVVVYIIITGFSASSFRATCMFLLFMLADVLNRTYDLKTAMAFSAFILLIKDPGMILQAGFLFSYLAVLGLAVINPVLQRYLKSARKSSPWQKIQTSLLSAFSVQVLIFPLLLWFYYQFSPYSFLLNLLIVPCMSLILLGGFAGLIPGCSFLLFLPDKLLDLYEWLCLLSEKLPGAVIVTGRPAVWQMILYYAMVILWLGWEKQKKTEKNSLAVVLFCMVVCISIFFLPVHRSDRIDMLSVGQGDCICMRDDTGRVILMDGGSSDVSQVGTYRVLPFLKYHGITKVDIAFISHAHEDHYSAILELLEHGREEGVRVDTLCLTEYAGVDETYEQIKEFAQIAGCNILYIRAGDKITCGNMQFYCIYPDMELSVQEENDKSMVLLAKLREFSMLLTGDSSVACDAEIIRQLEALDIGKIQCLKVAHHGARTSTSAALLEKFQFELALISCGKNNSYGHPHKETLERLKEAGSAVLITPQYGQITLDIEEEVKVYGYTKKYLK